MLMSVSDDKDIKISLFFRDSYPCLVCPTHSAADTMDLSPDTFLLQVTEARVTWLKVKERHQVTAVVQQHCLYLSGRNLRRVKAGASSDGCQSAGSLTEA